MMIDEVKLIEKLEARIKEITDTITPELKDDQPLVAILQSTRARALMDVKICIIDCINETPAVKQGDSWAGYVDRQGGSFDASEIANANTWR